MVGLSLGMAFGSIIIFYLVISVCAKVASKKLFNFDLKPYMKYPNVIFTVCMTIWIAAVVLFTFPEMNEGETLHVQTVETPCEVLSNTNVISETLTTKSKELSKYAKEDANSAVSEASSLFGSK